jgi:protein DJ-1
MSALILIANGTEEIELSVFLSIPSSPTDTPTPTSTIAYDTLVRAGVRCTSAFVAATSELTPDSGSLLVTCSRGVVIRPDALFDAEIHTAVRALVLTNSRIIDLNARSRMRLMHSSSPAAQ